MTFLPNLALRSWPRNDGTRVSLLKNVEKTSENLSPAGRRLVTFRGARCLSVQAVSLFLASVFFALWINTIHTSCPLDPLLTYSPVNEAVRYVAKQFGDGINSAFRGDPDTALDATWGSVSVDVKATRLTHEQFLMVGRNDSTAAVKYRPEDGGGYMAQLDAYHHLHCLDMLRKSLRRDHYATFDPSFNRQLGPHLGHCVEIIRQKLMCTSDLTMIAYDWVLGRDDPQPNLNTKHQCVDFERILDWSERHNAHVLRGHVVRFGDVTELAEDPL